MIEEDVLISLIEISNYFGSDSTRGGIEFQFRSIKNNAKRQKECFDKGGDPFLDLATGSDKSTKFQRLKLSLISSQAIFTSDFQWKKYPESFFRYSTAQRSTYVGLREIPY